MPDIKTKNVVKGTVKTIHKSAVAAERMKDAYIRTKDKAEHGVYSQRVQPKNMPQTVFPAVLIPSPVRLFGSLTNKAAVGFNLPKTISPKQKSIFGSGRLKNPLRRWSVAKKRSSRRQNPRVNLQLKRQRVQLRPHRKRLRLPNRPPELRLKRVNRQRKSLKKPHRLRLKRQGRQHRRRKPPPKRPLPR